MWEETLTFLEKRDNFIVEDFLSGKEIGIERSIEDTFVLRLGGSFESNKGKGNHWRILSA